MLDNNKIIIIRYMNVKKLTNNNNYNNILKLLFYSLFLNFYFIN